MKTFKALPLLALALSFAPTLNSARADSAELESVIANESRRLAELQTFRMLRIEAQNQMGAVRATLRTERPARLCAKIALAQSAFAAALNQAKVVDSVPHLPDGQLSSGLTDSMTRADRTIKSALGYCGIQYNDVIAAREGDRNSVESPVIYAHVQLQVMEGLTQTYEKCARALRLQVIGYRR
jgi:hypothetical protein